MPTVGWIREGDWEAFLEGTERTPDPGPPSPPTFQCPFCNASLATTLQLQNHVSGEHFVARPILFLHGNEPAEASVVRVSVRTNDFVVANTTSAEIAIDGSKARSTSLDALVNELTKLKGASVEIRLSNASQVRATPVTTRYEISFRIADASTLKNVEIAFSEKIMSSLLTRSLIDQFLNDPRCRGAGQDYAEALGSFALGILLKERPSSEHLTTPFARYRESYGAALRILSDFDRPFARLISDLVRFAFNDFARTNAPTGFWELDLACGLLKDPEVQKLPTAPSAETARRKICPVDHGTGQILDLAVRMSRQDRWSPILSDECRRIANSDVLDAMDRQKALAIWAIASWRVGAKEQGIEPLRQIAATYPFKSWAEPYLEMVTP